MVFKTGKDAETTAINLAEAINKDDVLKQYFTASNDSTGKLSVESKLDGTQTDNKKNAVQAIQFESVNKATSDARYNSFTEVTAKADMINNAAAAWEDLRTAAVGESYAFAIKTTADVSSAAATDALAASIDAARDLQDGNSVTINGKTYTYDAGKTDSDANSFKTLADLQKLLGDDYIVSAQITAKQIVTTYGAAATNKTDADGEEVSVSVKDAGKTIDIANLAASDFDDLKTEAFAANSTKISGFKDVKITLNIAEKSTTERPKDVMNFSLQVGADTTPENKISVDIESMSARSLGIDKVTVTGKDSTNADKAVNTIADAIAQVSKQRSALGAIQNRLEHTINNLDNVVENTTSAESAIRDTDMATEMVRYSNQNILAQAGQSMLAQANQSNQGVLSLLG